MAYKHGEEGFTKLEYGCRMAACLSYFMMRQRDAVGLLTFDSKVRTVLPPRTRQSHLKRLLGELDACRPGGETNLSGPMHHLAEGLKRRGLIIVISDLLDEPASVLQALQHFRFQGHEVIVFQIMDHAELTFPFDSMTEFTDLESGEKSMISPDGMRPLYLEQLKEFLGQYERGCADIKADYRLFDTKQPLEVALSEYLYRRSRLG
jgi:uncharacterized protein (DUF58 family)